ncbi:hypothetical protein TIFTF001_035205 [Ficus carica]|uniref:Uncharacterized protein n=1 Tax=Ficus carica TaxID=3494 RepID=A0AA88E1U0_FICCA|nr:hypothetical protein TIFTF001_035205 [Ficus carica]
MMKMGRDRYRDKHIGERLVTVVISWRH